MKRSLVWGDVVTPARCLTLAVTLAVGLGGGGCKQRPPFLIENTNGPDSGNGGSGGTGGGAGADAAGADTKVDTKLDAPKEPAQCLPPKPKTEECNGEDDDCNGFTDDVDKAKLQTDLANCGACFAICNPANAEPECTAGTCRIKTCRAGAFDANHDITDGCECLLSNGGVEICDGKDNNCDGQTDEGFDLATDVNNCGLCGKRCIFPFAKASCAAGKCVMGDCLAGFSDINKVAADGCEYACLPTNGGTEICDGQDNDCNGKTDEAVSPPSASCPKTVGVCAGAKPACLGIKGWVCDYGASFEEVEGTAKGCDNKDNDCDGKTDEGFDVGKACTIGSGACASTGSWVCDASAMSGRRCEGTPKMPMPEVCNGLDDDCDGKVDEIESLKDTMGGTLADQVAYLSAKDVTIFVYEASRQDAPTGGLSMGKPDPGFDSTHAPCSLAGRLPWSNVTKEEAEASCELLGMGWRLCSKDEWGAGCTASSCATPFPYGCSYASTSCNGGDFNKPSPFTTTIPTGSLASCTGDLGGGVKLFDMSGNVKEWVLTTVSPAAYELRGGAYNNISFSGSAPGLQCDASTPAPGIAVRLPSVGFRCCHPGMLPP